MTKVNNQFICLFFHPFEKYLVPVIYPKLQWALSTEVVKADLIPVFVQLMMEGTTITVYEVILLYGVLYSLCSHNKMFY